MRIRVQTRLTAAAPFAPRLHVGPYVVLRCTPGRDGRRKWRVWKNMPDGSGHDVSTYHSLLLTLWRAARSESRPPEPETDT